MDDWITWACPIPIDMPRARVLISSMAAPVVFPCAAKPRQRPGAPPRQACARTERRTIAAYRTVAAKRPEILRHYPTNPQRDIRPSERCTRLHALEQVATSRDVPPAHQAGVEVRRRLQMFDVRDNRLVEPDLTCHEPARGVVAGNPRELAPEVLQQRLRILNATEDAVCLDGCREGHSAQDFALYPSCGP